MGRSPAPKWAYWYRSRLDQALTGPKFSQKIVLYHAEKNYFYYLTLIAYNKVCFK
jgi:hypothetical protein